MPPVDSPDPARPPAGRFAPSPSGDLHVGNLRTALLAWLFARTTSRRFLIRVEDLDRVRPGAQERQLADLAAIGLDWDETPMIQSERLSVYDTAIARLSAQGLTYECFCTRKEILRAGSAPHAPEGAYPGTCRNLTAEQAEERRVTDRPPALRLRAEVAAFEVADLLAGTSRGPVDDLVLRRGDGVPAYNLAVVVDDAAQGVDQVVRGDDLLSSSPRQAYLATLLGLPVPQYVHVPLALNTAGQRLAKRDGAVTLAEMANVGQDAASVLSIIASSLGLASAGERVDAESLLARFDPTQLPREPWIFQAVDR